MPQAFTNWRDARRGFPGAGKKAMSIRAIAWVFQQNLAPLHKFVLVALADNANDTGLAFPSTETLARKTSMSRSSVKRALDRLVEQRWIEDTGKRTGNTKQIKVYRLTAAAEAGDGKGVSGTPLKGFNGEGKGVSGNPLRGSAGTPEPSGEPYKEPKRQLFELSELLSKDPRFDGLDVEEEIVRAVKWAEKKKRVLTQRFLENWLLHAEQPDVEEDEPEREGEYYSWRGWTEERKRALLELYPKSTLPPAQWCKLDDHEREEIEARVKKGWEDVR